MTSTLPNIPASPTAAATAGGILNPRPAGESALFPGMDTGGEGDFADLMAGGQACVAAMPRVISAAPAGVSVPVFAVGAPVVAEPVETGTPAVTGPSRDELEQAAAFAATVVQALQPLLVAPVPEMPVAPPAEAAAPRVEAPVLPNGRPFPTELPVQSRLVRPEAGPLNSKRPEVPVSAPVPVGEVPSPESAPAETVSAPAEQGGTAAFTLPNGRVFPTTLPEQAKPPFARLSEPARTETTPLQPVEQGSSELPATVSQPAPAQPTLTVAPDGAIECRITLPVARKSEPVAERTFPATDEAPLEVHAELEIPGQAVVRVQVLPPVVAGPDRAAEMLPENFAAFSARKSTADGEHVATSERNFLFSGDKEVRTVSENAGIAVAKTESAMIPVPTEEIRRPGQTETFPVMPTAVDFQVAQPVAERITAEPVAPAGQNFAERAVATVTSLAEAQFTASMQRAGSVQLRLKFGGEDLAVRVEMRGELVHTDFRTDSPALREAIAAEWQAVAAASPAHLQRFLDPVFSPATPGASTDAGAQHQSSHRQAQQQAQEHANARHDAWAGHAAFSRRSVLNESFIPEPATPRTPVMLPTSLRLSALA